MTIPETQSTLTPWDRKTMRLQTRLDEIDTEIARVRAKHADKITEANIRVENIQVLVSTFTHRKNDLQTTIERTHAALETAKAIVAKHEQVLIELHDTLAENDVQLLKLAEDLAAETTNRTVQLDEPSRHMAALDADRESVAYRLQQHQARKPNTALFVGVKP